jgi:hypothetical protein
MSPNRTLVTHFPSLYIEKSGEFRDATFKEQKSVLSLRFVPNTAQIRNQQIEMHIILNHAF